MHIQWEKQKQLQQPTYLVPVGDQRRYIQPSVKSHHSQVKVELHADLHLSSSTCTVELQRKTCEQNEFQRISD